MSDCCAENNENQQIHKRYNCPSCDNKFLKVPFKTLLHHVIEPWKFSLKEQAYYFCDDSDCDVVYFGLDNSIIHKDQLRIKVGIKETAEDALICYCFDVSKLEAKENKLAKAFVVEQTKNGSCSCTTHNPSGRCCLKDFPK